MQGVWYDGKVARPHPAEVAVEEGVLVIAAGEQAVRWPLAAVTAEDAGPSVRLSGPPGEEGRLVLDAAAWRAAAGPQAQRTRARRRRAEIKLVAALAVVGVAGLLFVFVGVPAASGPLAAATPISFEEQIGENLEDQLTTLLKPCRGDPQASAALAGIGEALEARSQSPLDVRVRAVQAPIVNAFALPGGAIFVTDELIQTATSPDELAGVIAHEVAHVEQRHVMRAVWRSLGAGLLLDIVLGGGTGAGQQAVLLAGSFTELSYSRELEREADARGIELLHAAGFSSQGLGSFFERLAGRRSDERARAAAEFLGSHPDSLRRAASARAAARPGLPALDARQWAEVRRLCRTPQARR